MRFLKAKNEPYVCEFVLYFVMCWDGPVFFLHLQVVFSTDRMTDLLF